MNYLVDTNVLCEPTKPTPDAKLVCWLEANDAHLFDGVLAVAEWHCLIGPQHGMCYCWTRQAERDGDVKCHNRSSLRKPN